MRERIKKIFSSRIFISVSGAIITYFILGIISSFAQKINLWESLFNLPVKIYHIKIPDFIILIFILIIVIWLILINKKFQGLSPKKFKEMLAENERIKKHNESLINSANNIIAVNEKLKTEIGKIGRENKAEIERAKKELLQIFKERENKINKKEKLEPHEEIIFILNLLASQPNRVLKQRNLWDKYHLKYKGRKEADFQIILNDLDNENLIHETTYGDFGEIAWIITHMGIEYFKRNRSKSKSMDEMIKEFKDIIIKAVHNANFSYYKGLYKNLEEEIVFEVTTAEGNKYIIAAHYWDPERGLISEQVEKYFNRTSKSEIPYIIATNASGLTQEALEDLEEFNKIFEEQKLFINFGSTYDEFIEIFLNL